MLRQFYAADIKTKVLSGEYKKQFQLIYFILEKLYQKYWLSPLLLHGDSDVGL